ncbi:GNAT family N-acetyltransferase [Brevibacillus ruminantium]|uniref:GNAT family N-acetyltransferase n=1 Tax=Brevibacillus ruminantium TaxID=2950604 RepID=A0ABY4WMH5_9BACL|nr:GNAT family N-acetyltransferase [Brevibacillus ruminantium]USG68361.1 GNAT family N-acetyltransferase [Brevibacillus ruminantium]
MPFMLAVEQAAVQNGMKRIWLLTTNDNLNARRFCQKRGYELVRLPRTRSSHGGKGAS